MTKTTLLTHNGVTRELQEWARLFGLAPKTVNARLERGWTLEQALTSTPPQMPVDYGKNCRGCCYWTTGGESMRFCHYAIKTGNVRGRVVNGRWEAPTKNCPCRKGKKK